MTTRTRTLMLLVAVLSAASAAAAASPDPLRCEARKLRCESDYLQCVSRCDRHAARLGHARPAAADSDCEDRCAVRSADHMLRIDARPPCAPAGSPDPMTCEARLLRIAASQRICQSHCAERERRTGEATDCLARCQTRCDTAVDNTLMEPVCFEGRMHSTEVCSDE